jgi:hypothetical protein
MQKHLPFIIAAVVIAVVAVAYFVTSAPGTSTQPPLQQLYPDATTGSTTTSTGTLPPPAPTSTPTTQGVIAGHVNIGPICPVEKNPPDPACQPGPAQYNAYKIVATNSSKAGYSASIDGQGNYRFALVPGTYTVDIAPHPHQGVGSISGVPATVRLEAGAQVTVNITIDTGIR